MVPRAGWSSASTVRLGRQTNGQTGSCQRCWRTFNTEIDPIASQTGGSSPRLPWSGLRQVCRLTSLRIMRSVRACASWREILRAALRRSMQWPQWKVKAAALHRRAGTSAPCCRGFAENHPADRSEASCLLAQAVSLGC